MKGLISIQTFRKFAKKMNLKGTKISVHKRDYAKIEKQINISINIFNSIPYFEKNMFNVFECV